MSARRLLPALALLAFPASAHGASLTTDFPCYVERTPVTYAGTGFTPGAEWEIEASQVFEHGTADATGSFVTRELAPINPNENTKAETITVNAHQADDSGNPVVATVQYKDVSFLVRAAHSAGNPRGHTRWGFSGFFPGKKIYIHVKRGRHVWTQKAGRANHPCGILHTRLRRLPAVPRSAIRSGTYRVVVDNNRHLKRKSRRYVFKYLVF